MKTAGAVLCVSVAFLSACGADGVSADGVDRDDPNFVTASLVMVSPGEALFSCVGHAAIRLECPHYKLDYCFSYESERAVSRLPAFFAGRLKMGLFAVPTGEFLGEYRRDGRGVRQYRLNLPPRVKQRLWKHMDDLAAQGANLPYDYMQRGCAKAVLDALKAACAPQTVKGPRLEITQRETFVRELAESHPWNLFFLQAIVGVETDTFTEVVTPKNLFDYLQLAMVEGRPLLTGEGRALLPQKIANHPACVTPWGVAWSVLTVVALALGAARTGRAPCRALAGGVVGVMGMAQLLAGCFFLYLICFSSLPATSWNWLFVPFNPAMPVVGAWTGWCRGCGKDGVVPRLARGLCVLCAAILGCWIAYMTFSPHPLTDPAYIVLSGAYFSIYGSLVISPPTRRWPAEIV